MYFPKSFGSSVFYVYIYWDCRYDGACRYAKFFFVYDDVEDLLGLM